ncbi:MAG: YkgJ family cysteine cluster protein [Promethearchaeota archaeon]|nr:MAG: YkgJ family cysteine cluster protein [Candidatus Lokiarchaeota archaeon]
MIILKYICQKCGTCCHEIPGESVKRIPLYPDEANILIDIAKKRNVDFKIIEDLVFPDIKNQKILVVTYRIRLDNETKGCPFYNKENGCTVHEIKPFACQAYPLALKRVDAFTFQIDIDPLCNFVIANYDELKNADINMLQEIFKDEYPKAEKFFRKNKKLMFKIRKLEAENKIKISRQISIEDFNKALKEWEREEIKVGKSKD